MAGKGIYYESQFEEATIELLREAHWQYTFGDDIHRKYVTPVAGGEIIFPELLDGSEAWHKDIADRLTRFIDLHLVRPLAELCAESGPETPGEGR